MDQQAKFKQMFESARRIHTLGELGATAGFCLVGLGLLWMALEAYRGRFQVTKGKALTGAPAAAVAVALALLAVGLVVFTLFFWPGVLSRGLP